MCSGMTGLSTRGVGLDGLGEGIAASSEGVSGVYRFRASLSMDSSLDEP